MTDALAQGKNPVICPTEIDTHLREILGLWFPRCLDREAGGFLEEFRRDWSHGEESGKAIVYQARRTWVAAEAAAYWPEQRDAFLGHCRHGLAFLVKEMRDAENGGVHFRLEKDGQGKFRSAAEKHAYGLSFAMYAGGRRRTGRRRLPRPSTWPGTPSCGSTGTATTPAAATSRPSPGKGS